MENSCCLGVSELIEQTSSEVKSFKSFHLLVIA